MGVKEIDQIKQKLVLYTRCFQTISTNNVVNPASLASLFSEKAQVVFYVVDCSWFA